MTENEVKLLSYVKRVHCYCGNSEPAASGCFSKPLCRGKGTNRRCGQLGKHAVPGNTRALLGIFKLSAHDQYSLVYLLLFTFHFNLKKKTMANL